MKQRRPTRTSLAFVLGALTALAVSCACRPPADLAYTARIEAGEGYTATE